MPYLIRYRNNDIMGKEFHARPWSGTVSPMKRRDKSDDPVRIIMRRYGLRTKREAVEMALRHLAGQPMTREEALAMRGAHLIVEVPADYPSA